MRYLNILPHGRHVNAKRLANGHRLRFDPGAHYGLIDHRKFDGLRAAFTDALGSSTATTHGESVLLSERQLNAVRGASEALLRAQNLAQDVLEELDCAETLAFELRDALDLLGAVTGEVTTDDLLGEVFANFCIGK